MYYLMKISRNSSQIHGTLIYQNTLSYETDSWVDVTSVNFNSKNVYEDEVFVRQDILQFFSEVSKDYKYAKTPQTG